MRNSLLLLMLLMTLSQATCGMVKIEGSATDYGTITNAVEAAVPGSHIMISTGTYFEAVNIAGKSLTLEGGYNHDCTAKVLGQQSVIDANALLGGGSALDITGSLLSLIDLDVRGGSSPIAYTAFFGGGLDIRDGSVVTARNCRVHNNSAKGKGGGIYVLDSDLSLVNTMVDSNRCHVETVAVTLHGHGGGIYVENGSLDVSGTSPVTNNWAQNYGGGIYVVNGTAVLRGDGVAVKYNTASNGAGVAVNHGLLRVYDSAAIGGNIAQSWGGGVLLFNASTGVFYGAGTYVGNGYHASDIGPNRVTNGCGGGLAVLGSSLVISNQAEVGSNQGTVGGGGLYLSNSWCLVDGAGIGFANQTNAAGLGGSVAAYGSRLVLTNGAYVQGGRAIVGGGIYAQYSTVDVCAATFIGGMESNQANLAWMGGGLAAQDGQVNLAGSVWNNSSALGPGGGLELSDCVLMARDAQIIGNTAPTSGGYYGGGIDWNGGTGMLQNVTILSNAAAYGGGLALRDVVAVEVLPSTRISHNRAGVSGGGIYLGTTGAVQFTGATVERNTAGVDGGGYYMASGRVVQLIGNNISRNTAGVAGGGLCVSNTGMVVCMAIGSNAYIYYNSAPYGGGMAVRAQGQAVLFAPNTNDLYLTGNSAFHKGGGAWIDRGWCSALKSVMIGGNTAEYGGGLYVEPSSRAYITHFGGAPGRVYNNTATFAGGGILATGVDSMVGLDGVIFSEYWGALLPNEARGTSSSEINGGGGVAVLDGATLAITNSRIANNLAENNGGGILVHGGRVMMVSRWPGVSEVFPPNFMEGNRATNNCGGAIWALHSLLNLQDVMILSNRALRGGGLHIDSGCTVTVANAICSGNSASFTGAGVRVYGSTTRATMLHCTVADNWGDGISVTNGAILAVSNSIVWGNTGEQLAGLHPVGFTTVQGGYPGTGNLDTDPAFLAPAVQDYRLRYGSPSITSGVAIAAVPADCRGRLRNADGLYDRGAYEYDSAFDDSDRDRMVDAWEATYGLNPLDPADAAADNDTDTFVNLREYVADTHPLDSNSYLRVEFISNAAARAVGFLTSASRLYALRATRQPTNNAAWMVVGTNVNLAGSGGMFVAVDTNMPPVLRYYSVEARLP